MAEHCRKIVGELNAALAEQRNRDEFAALAAGPDADEVLEAICQMLTPAGAAEARAEFGTLPRNFLIDLINNFKAAHDGGMPFELVSEPPEHRVATARAGRVEWSVAYDNGGVTMTVAHVHGHHAAWFTADAGALA